MKVRLRDDECVCYPCPGCGREHQIPTDRSEVWKDGPRWNFNRDVDNPTLEPSVNCSPNGPNRCHHFVRNGVIQFLNDCQHSLAGQNVKMAELE